MMKCGECEHCVYELLEKDNKYTGFKSIWCDKVVPERFIVEQSCSKPYPRTSPRWCPLKGDNSCG